MLRSTIAVFAIPLIVVGLVGCASTAKSPMANLSQADLDSMHRIDGLYDQALRKGDLETAVKTIYSEDVVVMPGDSRPFRGHKALVNHLKSLEAKDWQHRPVTTTGRGDLAVELSEWKVKANVNGQPSLVSGTCVDILRRQPDGRWLIVAETFTIIPSGEFPGLTEMVQGTSLNR